MRTNSGVKPKMKGNAVFTALLFLLCTLPAFSHSPILPFSHSPILPFSHSPIHPFSHFPDTLILGGEIIEIKQKAIKTDTDSLAEARKKDVVKIRSPYLISIGAHTGLSAGFFNISSLGDTLTSVNEFLELKNKVQVNSHFGLDVRLPIYKGLDLGVGYYFNAISLEVMQIDESTLCPEEERVSFENRGGQLWQNYVVFIDPGYETREDQVTEAGARYSLTASLSASVDLGYNTKQKELSTSGLHNWDWSSAYLRVGVIKSFDLFKPASLFSK